jgi:hypothetical protein
MVAAREKHMGKLLLILTVYLAPMVALFILAGKVL